MEDRVLGDLGMLASPRGGRGGAGVEVTGREGKYIFDGAEVEPSAGGGGGRALVGGGSEGVEILLLGGRELAGLAFVDPVDEVPERDERRFERIESVVFVAWVRILADRDRGGGKGGPGGRLGRAAKAKFPGVSGSDDVGGGGRGRR
jgi:hypothetical protein